MNVTCRDIKPDKNSWNMLVGNTLWGPNEHKGTTHWFTHTHTHTQAAINPFPHTHTCMKSKYGRWNRNIKKVNKEPSEMWDVNELRVSAFPLGRFVFPELTFFSISPLNHTLRSCCFDAELNSVCNKCFLTFDGHYVYRNLHSLKSNKNPTKRDSRVKKYSTLKGWSNYDKADKDSVSSGWNSNVASGIWLPRHSGKPSLKRCIWCQKTSNS